MTKVNIRFNSILNRITKGHNRSLFPDKFKDSMTKEEIEAKVKAYTEAWEAVAEKTISAIEQMAGKPFPYSQLNVNLVEFVQQTEAFALIIPMNLTPKGFIRVLTHELMHLSGGSFTEEFKKKYERETVDTTVHIIIHAMTESLWRDVLDMPELVDRHKELSQKNGDMCYIRAWEIVDQEGYKHIIKNYIKRE